VAKRLVAAGKPGRVVNIGSTSAFRPDDLQSVYNSSKAALVQFTRSIAVELAAHKILVNAVIPGPVRTTNTEWVYDDPDIAAQIKVKVPWVALPTSTMSRAPCSISRAKVRATTRVRCSWSTAAFCVPDGPQSRRARHRGHRRSDAVMARALVLGATVVHDLVDQADYPSRDFTVADPDGNHWTFATFAG
jgi:NAD(P)-dependent dehydrogenase (short-subunit alcohol dehydrogenase family)